MAATWDYNTSTCQNIDALMSNFTPTTTNKSGTVLIDMFNYNMEKAINAIVISDSDTYVAGQRLPVIAYNKSGNTSCYWMLGIASGVMHPYNMKGGDAILIPNTTAIIASISSTNAQENSQSTTSEVTI